VIRENGDSLPVTDDFNPNRINVSVEEGKIVDALFDQQLNSRQ
jgi:hypothetical protein